MLSHARTAVKFLTYGLVIGLLFAPRSGKETRSELISWVGNTIKETMSNVTSGSQGDTTKI